LKVEFMNAQGDLVRSFSSTETDRQAKITKKSGMNRFNWNLSMTNFKGVDGVFVGLGAGGHRVAPGDYKAVITYGETVVEKDITVNADPRWEAGSNDYATQQTFLNTVREMIENLQEKANDIRSIRTQIEDLKARISEDDYASVHEKADEVLDMINTSEAEMVQPKQKTFQDVINFENKLEVQLLHIYGTIDGIEPPITNGQKKRVGDMELKYTLVMDQASTIEKGLDDLMDLIRAEKVPFIAPKKKK